MAIWCDDERIDLIALLVNASFSADNVLSHSSCTLRDVSHAPRLPITAMPDSAPQFVFMTCRPGAETALKREVALAQPLWRFAFSRPGFLTFKHCAEEPLSPRALAERRWTLAHSHGLSLGRLVGAQLKDLAQQVWQHEGVLALAGNEARLDDVHVWQSATPAAGTADSAPRGELAPQPFSTPLVREIEDALREIAPDEFAKLRSALAKNKSRERRPPTHRDALVLDVFALAPGEWWIGCHLAATTVERWPGGYIPAALPPHAVSRAYTKLDEAIRWSNLPFAEGDECVEIGCAPGGASQALLDRGLFVTGIDPANVDRLLLENPRFRHLKKRGSDVRRSEFLGVRWLVADMNIAPQATLDEVEPIVKHPGVAIRGLVITLKLSEWSLAEHLDEFAQRVRSWGYRDVRMRQLTNGGQEVCLVALRRKALRRLGRKSNRRGVRRGGRTASRNTAPGVGDAAPMAIQRADRAQTELSGPHF